MAITQKISPQIGHACDLRTWLKDVEDLGQIERIQGAHWDLEMGALTEIILERLSSPPAIMFKEVRGYPSTCRVLVNMLETLERTALTVNLTSHLKPIPFIDALISQINDETRKTVESKWDTKISRIEASSSSRKLEKEL